MAASAVMVKLDSAALEIAGAWLAKREDDVADGERVNAHSAQHALAALLAALGLSPSKARVQTVFKKWAQAEPHPLRLTTEAAGGAWKMRESTKVKNLSFVLAPPSVPSNLNVYGEGLVRLGILQSSASVWNGEFSEAQWAALLAWGKVPPPPPPAPAARAHGLATPSARTRHLPSKSGTR